MEISGAGKSPSASLSFRYTANNEELEELFNACEDDPLTPQCDPPSTAPSENASPKKGDRTPSIIDKYFKSMRSEKTAEKEKPEDAKSEAKDKEESRSSTPKDNQGSTSSPMKEYLNRLGKRSTPELIPDVKEGSNETWKIFHDFKFKIAQAVEDMKTKSLEETKEEKKSIPRDNSTSDSEENSAFKDIDQQSVGDTDNQVSSLESSMQNLSELSQPITAKATERDLSFPVEKTHSDSSDDTHKNLVYSEVADVRDYLTDSLLDVESGIEALEDTMDGFGDVTSLPVLAGQNNMPTESTANPSPTMLTNFGLPPSKSDLHKSKLSQSKRYFLNFTMYFLTIFLIVNYVLFPDKNVWNGFLLGIWSFCLASNLKHWVLDNYFTHWEPRKRSFFEFNGCRAMPATYTIPSVKEHQPLKKYEGWINHFRYPDYEASSHHINKTTTAFMKLEGCNLRISYTKTKVAKRALWDEKIDNITFYQHRLYNLCGARVILLPKGLVKRRQWSKKYPICVILNDSEKIQVLEKENSQTDRKVSDPFVEKRKDPQHETESTETNTSPEKKKKFIWRRREKSVSHSDGETGREGLRHRLVRKMHRDKKADSVSICTEPVTETQNQDDKRSDKTVVEEPFALEMELSTKSATSNKDEEDDFDDNELSRIKEFLEEAEFETGVDGTVEGEWTVHVKRSKDTHSRLYLFARTGRDKHEWFRRLTTAISEANPCSAESSTSEEKSSVESPAGSGPGPGENKDGIELAIYKMSEKDSVAFAKSNIKAADSTSEAVTITSLSQPMSHDSESYEKNFWPYLLKIIQSKTPSPTCECRLLPSEVAWVNTALARLMYDITRDPIMIACVQHRIQRKLNTLKLPSFMSPLVVTELSLSGACPLVERVLPVSYDARGVWLDADLRYDGGAYIALSTQINLMKLKEKNMTLEEHLLATKEGVVENEETASPTVTNLFKEKMRMKKKPAIYDSEAEDSAESSSDDDIHPMQPVDSNENMQDTTLANTEGGSSKKKFLRMVDKIATNKYFQQVTDYKYVKRAMEGLSNTDIKLHLEIHGLEGRLALNLPPPPHDRVWIGFRTNPQLVLKARPAVGARTLRFAHISNWIEQKLSKEFEKVLVLPNMEDIIISVMTPTPVFFE